MSIVYLQQARMVERMPPGEDSYYSGSLHSRSQQTWHTSLLSSHCKYIIQLKISQHLNEGWWDALTCASHRSFSTKSEVCSCVVKFDCCNEGWNRGSLSVFPIFCSFSTNFLASITAKPFPVFRSFKNWFSVIFSQFFRFSVTQIWHFPVSGQIFFQALCRFSVAFPVFRVRLFLGPFQFSSKSLPGPH